MVLEGVSFNEAADFCRRKLPSPANPDGGQTGASMRPPTFAGGNLSLLQPVGTPLFVASMRPPTFAGGNTVAGGGGGAVTDTLQ